MLPETFLLRLQELARTFVGQKVVGKKGQSLVPLIYEPHPLTNLEGIDIYDRARLTDEGVTNIEGLAHHDFVDLLMKTRIPVPRLIDWVDQAILKDSVILQALADEEWMSRLRHWYRAPIETGVMRYQAAQ